METKYYRPIVRILCFAVLGLFVFMTSCKKNNVGPDMLRADMSDFSVNNQKAYIDAQRYNCFEEGEKVRVNNSPGTIVSLARNDRHCVIDGIPSAENYYAFYPTDLLANENVNLSGGVHNISVDLKEQVYEENNGHQSIKNPMAAELIGATQDDNILHFRNLCALFKVDITTIVPFDKIRITTTLGNVPLSGAGTVAFNGNVHQINMGSIGSGSGYAHSDVILKLPQGHTGKIGGESFYIVVPAFKITTNHIGDGNSLVLEILNGTTLVKRYKKTLQVNDEVLANHIYSIGEYTFYTGLFSVSETKKVIFAPGNLQWSYNSGATHVVNSTDPQAWKQGTFRFAENQYDIMAHSNNNASATYNGWIDLFCWGSSGYGTTRPYDMDTYYSGNNDIANTLYDWGLYNSIYNPKKGTTDPYGTWRTLTYEEWDYVLNKRGGYLNQDWTTSDEWKQAWWRFNLVNVVSDNDKTTVLYSGLLLYPDGFVSRPSCIQYCTTLSGYDDKYYKNHHNSNPLIITKTEYDALEALGCAFLPLAGRAQKEAGHEQDEDVFNLGEYWSATKTTYAGSAYYLKFEQGGGPVFPTPLNNVAPQLRSEDIAVRLVHDVK